ncbi:MAG TPA: HEAT repeat domain-containing protein [Rhodocyclaceae bacterium]|nr:HEAT repeat domain-containing protein [Rhodocyclaceae bacterium]
MSDFDYPQAAPSTREALVLHSRLTDAAALAEHFHVLLMEGGLQRVLDAVGRRPELLAGLLPIVANPEAAMNVRLGASVVFERYAGTPALQALVPALGELAAHADARVRADACHFLGLSATAAAVPYLQRCLEDEDADVREIAADGLEALAERPKAQEAPS